MADKSLTPAENKTVSNDKTIIRSASGGPLYQLADDVERGDIQSTLGMRWSLPWWVCPWPRRKRRLMEAK